MSKKYYLNFGAGNPADNSGLSPTFITFSDETGQTLTPPGITEITAGFYQFEYGPTLSIAAVIDGGAALAASDRYISAVLDPLQTVDQKIGNSDSSFGTTGVDPQTLFGFAKRSQEFFEGDATFTKATGKWRVFSRGSSTLLREKDLTNNTTVANKS